MIEAQNTSKFIQCEPAQEIRIKKYLSEPFCNSLIGLTKLPTKGFHQFACLCLTIYVSNLDLEASRIYLDRRHPDKMEANGGHFLRSFPPKLQNLSTYDRLVQAT